MLVKTPLNFYQSALLVTRLLCILLAWTRCFPNSGCVAALCYLTILSASYSRHIAMFSFYCFILCISRLPSLFSDVSAAEAASATEMTSCAVNHGPALMAESE